MADSTVIEEDSDGRPVEFDKPVHWVLSITGENDVREYRLDHMYRTESGAVKEAESIADYEFRESDVGWAVGADPDDY